MLSCLRWKLTNIENSEFEIELSTQNSSPTYHSELWLIQTAIFFNSRRKKQTKQWRRERSVLIFKSAWAARLDDMSWWRTSLTYILVYNWFTMCLLHNVSYHKLTDSFLLIQLKFQIPVFSKLFNRDIHGHYILLKSSLNWLTSHNKVRFKLWC